MEENVSNLAKIISEYGILVVISASFLILSYRMFTKQQKWFDKMMNRVFNSSNYQYMDKEEISALELVNEKIYQEVLGVLSTIDSDRAYVYLYHNGGMSSSGLHFQKMSCICEVVGQGVLPVASTKQALHRASYSTICDSIKHEGFSCFRDIESLKGRDNFMYNEFKSCHTESAYFSAVRDCKDNIIGFLGVDYCSSCKLSDREVVNVLNKSSSRLSHLVDIRDEVK